MIAILRGISPSEAASHANVLYQAGFRIIEVPLNSPRPLNSIAAIRGSLPNDTIVGAGTVLNQSEVKDVKEAGGELIVMPHSDKDVIAAAKKLEMTTAAGVATPSEAFAALKHGADVIKMFPFEQLGGPVLKAWRSVMPSGVALIPVGGIGPEDLADLTSVGATGFGLGSGLYKAGQDLETTRMRALAYSASLRELIFRKDEESKPA